MSLNVWLRKSNYIAFLLIDSRGLRRRPYPNRSRNAVTIHPYIQQSLQVILLDPEAPNVRGVIYIASRHYDDPMQIP